MNKSQRRTSGKTFPKSGDRIKLIAVLTLAVSAAGFFAMRAADDSPVDVVERLSGSDCSPTQSLAADVARDCDSVAPRKSVQITSGHPDDTAPITVSSFQDHADSDLDGGWTGNPRTWNANQPGATGLRYGHTMAELCRTGLDGKQFRCQTGSYDEMFDASESVATSDSVPEETISGHVLTNEGAGLGGVRIVASPERLDGPAIPVSGKLRFWTETDSRGAYTLNGLPAGEYTVRSGAHGVYQSTRISVRSGIDYADLVVTRNSVADIEGQVLGSAGEPLEGVTVLPMLLGQPSVLTGYDGRFRLSVTLKPSIDSFALRFQRPGFREQTSTVALPRGVSDSAAVRVVMHQVESWTSVSGTVRGDSGEPLAGRKVELRPRSARQTYTTLTDSRGEFTVPVVAAPADYGLIVFGGAEHKDYQRSVHVTPDMDELNIVAEAYEFGEVSGRLINSNGVPVPNFELVLRNTGSRMPNAVVSTDQFGNFDIPTAPAGELVMASQSTPSILVQGLQLRPGDKLHVPLVLDWGEHQIRGVVVDAYDNPVPASRIILQWTHEAGGISTSATRRAAANTQGHFSFSDLGPGPHSLQIRAPGFRTTNVKHDLSRQGYDLTVRLN